MGYLLLTNLNNLHSVRSKLNIHVWPITDYIHFTWTFVRYEHGTDRERRAASNEYIWTNKSLVVAVCGILATNQAIAELFPFVIDVLTLF